jgi:hypothetical protein
MSNKVMFKAFLFVLANAGMLWFWLLVFRSPLPWAAWIGAVAHIMVLFNLKYDKIFSDN